MLHSVSHNSIPINLFVSSPQRDREMGSSRLPPSASMAALVFGFLVLSALPELVAGVTRHYTFNVGAVQILSICRNGYS